MRADGDIDKETFRKKKVEIEQRIDSLNSELRSMEFPTETSEKQDYRKMLENIRQRLQELTVFSEQQDIPDTIVEAFIKRIFVQKEEFKWYLRPDGEVTSQQKTEAFHDCTEGKHLQLCSFIVTKEMAQQYIYSKSTQRRVLFWKDLKVSVWL